MDAIQDTYHGFEQGPIRPPSEAQSLFIRITRNCPWNKCTFCPVYKGSEFSIRPVDHVKRDIDEVYRHLEYLQQVYETGTAPDRRFLNEYSTDFDLPQMMALQAAYYWLMSGGMKSVFLQDANSLIIKAKDLVEILVHLYQRFPGIVRVTSYARAQTVAHRSDNNLRALALAGLTRVHIGLESGSDTILALTKKGVTKAEHIEAGKKIVDAGMELSEYVMPGLGGRELSAEHARETADALNQINPQFIRLRTLALPPGIPLSDEFRDGDFKPCSDREIVEELISLIEQLDGITSMIKSDHVLNLFENLEGQLPDEKPQMLTMLHSFLDLKPQEQHIYQIGRRMGYFHSLSDLQKPTRRDRAERMVRQLGVTDETIDDVIREMMMRFV